MIRSLAKERKESTSSNESYSMNSSISIFSSDNDSDHDDKSQIKMAINSTIKYMEGKDIQVLDCKEEPNFGSCWYELCLVIFAKYSYLNAKRIKSWYTTDKYEFKSKILEYFFYKKTETAAVSNKQRAELNKTYSFSILKSELENFKSITKKRPFLLRSFGNLLTKVLQEKCEVRCYIKPLYNWLCVAKFNNSKHKNIWSGVYICIDNNCKKEFFFYMKNYPANNNQVIINCKWNDENIHSNKLTKVERVSGFKRKIMALDIKSNGTQLFYSS